MVHHIVPRSSRDYPGDLVLRRLATTAWVDSAAKFLCPDGRDQVSCFFEPDSVDGNTANQDAVAMVFFSKVHRRYPGVFFQHLTAATACVRFPLLLTAEDGQKAQPKLCQQMIHIRGIRRR